MTEQQKIIAAAMKEIAQRRPGKSRLVYDKTGKTIVMVVDGEEPRPLNISAQDADEF